VVIPPFASGAIGTTQQQNGSSRCKHISPRQQEADPIASKHDAPDDQRRQKGSRQGADEGNMFIDTISTELSGIHIAEVADEGGGRGVVVEEFGHEDGCGNDVEQVHTCQHVDEDLTLCAD